ncbi:MAG TPA: HAD-IA family hydrolase [Candidatus Andersenbacteria bacterium]|nr:HAD-IA family hydrolase [Candidatus Andersenbacteria bacterium]
MIQTIIFDLDGTLLDTKEFIFQAFEHVFKTFNLTNLSRANIDSVMGVPLEEGYEILVPELDRDQLCVVHRAFQTENMSLVQPFKNTIQTLEKLQSVGIKMAVVSTRKKTGMKSLSHVGITQYFDCLITGDDVENFKPDPEGIHKALAYLKSSATSAIMVGDSIVDVQAGKNAKTATAAVTYGLGSRKSLEESQADYILQDISEVFSILR